MLRFIFSLCLVTLTLLTYGQQPAGPPSGGDQETPRPTGPRANEDNLLPKPDWNPHELKVGFNAIRSGRTFFGSDLITHEIQSALTMHQLVVVLDLGIEENTFGGDYAYENVGRYFRFGGDWSFVKDKKSGNAISLGLRYARAGFNDRLEYTADQGFGTADLTFENRELNARWAEVTFNLRGKIVSNLYMGFTMRWQFMRKVNGEGMLETFNIPGFGNTKRGNSTAFDYYFMWRIPFK